MSTCQPGGELGSTTGIMKAPNLLQTLTACNRQQRFLSLICQTRSRNSDARAASPALNTVMNTVVGWEGTL